MKSYELLLKLIKLQNKIKYKTFYIRLNKCAINIAFIPNDLLRLVAVFFCGFQRKKLY